jgi:hypothetical protein
MCQNSQGSIIISVKVANLSFFLGGEFSFCGNKKKGWKISEFKKNVNWGKKKIKI